MEVFILNARRALCEGKDAWSAVAGEETANKGLQAEKVPYLMLLAIAALCAWGARTHVRKGYGAKPTSLPEIYLANWHTLEITLNCSTLHSMNIQTNLLVFKNGTQILRVQIILKTEN
jgi:hypothetical protein